jgi:hypothetical protein
MTTYPDIKYVHGTGSLDSDTSALVTQFNNLVAAVRLITAALDTAVTGTSAAAILASGVAGAPSVVTKFIG